MFWISFNKNTLMARWLYYDFKTLSLRQACQNTWTITFMTISATFCPFWTTTLNTLLYDCLHLALLWKLYFFIKKAVLSQDWKIIKLYSSFMFQTVTSFIKNISLSENIAEKVMLNTIVKVHYVLLLWFYV